jgi:hypothetical protein
LFADLVSKVKPIDAGKLNLQIQEKFQLLQSGKIKTDDQKHG